MAVEITIPRLGWNMEEGIFAGWLKRDGDTVQAGEAVFRLESEKATQDIECLDAGILRILPHAPKEGDTLAVGAVIAYLVQPGEAAPFEGQPATIAAPENEVRAGLENPALASHTQSALDQKRTRHHEKVSPSAAISPRARRIADELGVAWSSLHGSGRTGRIREADVRAAYEQRQDSRSYPAASIQVIRRRIAERMLESRRATAPVTLTTTADATNLVHLRKQFKADAIVPGYTDLIVQLTARALRDHAALNARWEKDRVLLVKEIHIGIAVDTPAGLFVPVLRDVPNLTLQDIAARSRDLLERARQHKLRREEMQGSTFTVTNLGAFDIDAFTPIINFPECAILGLGRIQRRPTVQEERIVIRDQITLSLTFDHRVVDGAPAARFLQKLSQMIENAPGFLTVPAVDG
ncbi:MAG TPA: dihydrolipoamide acetyltransferase family protein [Gemmataceae bacterium]|jgi:pyruvate dehydrogenase E2 component (dihydrolipoamide acetyltransferase)|nr:dihydrolipoamide acetyltransferase family protein [Gemmataceae bacterium]